MINKKVSTFAGSLIILAVVVALGIVFCPSGENGEMKDGVIINNNIINSATENQAAKNIENNQEEVNYEQDIPEAIEQPTIVMRPGMKLEDVIKEALYKKIPDWKVRNYDVSVTVETNRDNHAIGRFVYDGYNIIKDGKYHNTGEGIWFAVKSDEAWTLVESSSVGYWGTCQNFTKYKFPSDMTPDCWDTEKNVLINTNNPEKFYGAGFTKEDKKELIQAYIEYANKNAPEGRSYRQSDKSLYVRVNKSIGNYLRGTFFIGGSNIGFYAIKQSGKWIIIYSGQDSPACSLTDPYNFPNEIVKCK